MLNPNLRSTLNFALVYYNYYESQLHFYDYRPCYKKGSEQFTCNEKKAYFIDPGAEQYFETFVNVEGESSMKPKQLICQDLPHSRKRLQIDHESINISKHNEIEKVFELFDNSYDWTRNEVQVSTLNELNILASSLNEQSIAVVHHYKEIYYYFTVGMRKGITNCDLKIVPHILITT